MSAPTYTFTVNGTDYTKYLVQDSWEVNEVFSRQGGTASFTLVDTHAHNSWNILISAKTTVILTDTTIGKVIFAGLVQNPKMTWLSPIENQWDLDCKDYTDFFDTTYVHGDFFGDTADVIIKALVAQSGLAISTAGVLPGPTIPRFKINYKTLSDAMTSLAQMSAVSGSYYGWFIDPTLTLQFFSYAQAQQTGLSFSDNPPSTLSTTQGSIDPGATYEQDASNLRSWVIVRGATYRKTQTDKFTGDGHTQQWVMTYPVDYNENNTDTNLTCTVSGARQGISIITSQTQAITTPFWIQQNSQGQWTLLTSSAPASGAKIELHYSLSSPIVAIANSPTSMAAYNNTINGGKWMSYISNSELTTAQAALQRGQAELVEYQYQLDKITFTTNEGWPGHLHPGDQFTFILSAFQDPSNPSASLTGEFIATSVRISGVGGGYRKYEVEALRIV